MTVFDICTDKYHGSKQVFTYWREQHKPAERVVMAPSPSCYRQRLGHSIASPAAKDIHTPANYIIGAFLSKSLTLETANYITFCKTIEN